MADALVKRLRAYSGIEDMWETMHEAADRIEELEETLKWIALRCGYDDDPETRLEQCQEIAQSTLVGDDD